MYSRPCLSFPLALGLLRVLLGLRLALTTGIVDLVVAGVTSPTRKVLDLWIFAGFSRDFALLQFGPVLTKLKHQSEHVSVVGCRQDEERKSVPFVYVRGDHLPCSCHDSSAKRAPYGLLIAV